MGFVRVFCAIELSRKSVGKREGDAHWLAALVVTVNYGAEINEGRSFASRKFVLSDEQMNFSPVFLVLDDFPAALAVWGCRVL